jgi:hypothetical protein
MYPHQIRLGPPWERLEGEPARWRRRFGRPRQIDDWERVWLIPIAGTKGEWRLNQAPLEWNRRGDGLQRADVTGQLKERNEIVAELTGDDPGAILEIGCRAFIQDVKIDGSKVAIVVSSESADDPLELYVLIDGETHGYFGPFSTNDMLTQEFRVVDLEWKAGAVIRVDLICRSTIWDTIESSIV